MATADLHIHTHYSFDGTASVARVLAAAQKAGLDLIAITDHDVIEGALEAEALAPQYGIAVIPGIEVTTAEGDLLVYNVRQALPAKKSLLHTLRLAAEMGGVAVAAHPLSSGWGMNSVSHYSVIAALRDEVAARTLIGIETYNATALDQKANLAAAKLANHTGLACFGNSDSHTTGTIGAGRTVFAGHGWAGLLASAKARQTMAMVARQPRVADVLASWAGAYALRALPFIPSEA